jgi:hypothetical protein
LTIKVREGQLGLTPQQSTRLKEWRDEVRVSIRRGEELYRRDRRYDRLFALLFPDLVPDIGKRSLIRSSPDVDELPALDRFETVDEKFFQEPYDEYWIWTIKNPQRDHELELAASRARIDG